MYGYYDSDGCLIIQRRTVGRNQTFNRTWGGYEYGFRRLKDNGWLGLRFINLLTRHRRYKIQFYVEYDDVDNKRMKYHSGKRFGTWDEDTDRSSMNCVTSFGGGWCETFMRVISDVMLFTLSRYHVCHF
ncbi:fibrinogen-like protein 1-like protein [Gigantopelta aegis]|uniref:fibrinogen-like protein 1-like protein n=1 Tax=Gigantopelta aegis TaxID=1735272 RepID=UPI001B889F75|nr:fibrinogen-like protein 1-like protein [Gigantopelta aegis]